MENKIRAMVQLWAAELSRIGEQDHSKSDLFSLVITPKQVSAFGLALSELASDRWEKAEKKPEELILGFNDSLLRSALRRANLPEQCFHPKAFTVAWRDNDRIKYRLDRRYPIQVLELEATILEPSN